MQKGTLGGLVACAVASFAVTGLAEPSAEEYTLQIPPQSIQLALQEFSKQTGFNVSLIMPDNDQQRFVVTSLSGRYTVESALKHLLGESGLTFTRVNDRTIAVAPKSSQQDRPLTMSEADNRRPYLQRLAERSFLDEETGKPFGVQRVAAVASAEPGRILVAQSNDTARAKVTEEVVVTAQKRSENILDVPVPVTSISAKTLAETNLLRVQDYYHSIPGVNLTIAGNGGEPAIAIRGITTGSTNNPTVATVIDEVSYGGSVTAGAQTLGLADVDPGDLAHVEVLRGPQGTLYGASSIGGLLKFVTVDPSMDEIGGHVQLGSTAVADSDDVGYSVRGSLNAPLGDTFAVRVSGFDTHDPGYVDNIESGERDVNDRDGAGGRFLALWRPSDAFSLKLSAVYQDIERKGSQDVDTRLGGDPKQSYLAGTGLYERITEAYGATATANLGNVTLVSATGYSVDELSDTVDTTLLGGGLFGQLARTFFGVNRAVTRTDLEIEKFSQELRVSLPIGDRLNWLIGGFYTEESMHLLNDTQATDTTLQSAGTLARTEFDEGKFKDTAIFTNVTVELTDRWDVQVGGRFSRNEQSFPTRRTGALFGPTPIVASRISAEDEAFTYLVTPRFKISPDLMLYLRAASGYRPGGPNSACGMPDVPCRFESDTTENYDLGMKGEVLGGALTFDASLYYIDWKDIQISGILTPARQSYTGNVSRAESRGVELSIATTPLTGMTIALWGAYNEAELVEDFPVGSLFGRAGDRLPYSSRFSGNFSINQSFPLWNGATGSLGGSVSYVGDRVGNFRSTAARQLYGPYAQIDLRAGVALDTWTLSLFVNNVANREGVLRTGLDAVMIPSYTTYIQPRTAGLSLAKSF